MKEATTGPQHHTPPGASSDACHTCFLRKIFSFLRVKITIFYGNKIFFLTRFSYFYSILKFNVIPIDLTRYILRFIFGKFFSMVPNMEHFTRVNFEHLVPTPPIARSLALSQFFFFTFFISPPSQLSVRSAINELKRPSFFFGQPRPSLSLSLFFILVGRTDAIPSSISFPPFRSSSYSSSTSFLNPPTDYPLPAPLDGLSLPRTFSFSRSLSFLVTLFIVRRNRRSRVLSVSLTRTSLYLPIYLSIRFFLSFVQHLPLSLSLTLSLSFCLSLSRFHDISF